MKSTARRIGFLAMLAVFAMAAAAQAGPGAKAIAWKTDYKKAIAAAKKQNKPVFIDFYSQH